LSLVGEIVVILTCLFSGSLSDKLGFKLTYWFGFVVISIALAVYPLGSSLAVVFLFRVVFAIGASALGAMIPTVQGDYVAQNAKGRSSAMVGIAAGLGAVFAAIFLLRIPKMFARAGASTRWATTQAFWIVSVMCVGFSAMAALLKATPSASSRTQSKWSDTMRQGLRAAVDDPNLALSYACGLIARGDSYVLSQLLFLWIFHHEVGEGKSEADANARGGVITGIGQTCGLLVAPLVGYICDRLDRRVALGGAAAFNIIGYIGMASMSSPTSTLALVCACFIGAGEMAVIVTSQALVTQVAPADSRGTTGGCMEFFGSVGIVSAAQIGGVLYDKVSHQSPFWLFAVVNASVAIAAATIVLRERSTGNLTRHEPIDVEQDSIELIQQAEQ